MRKDFGAKPTVYPMPVLMIATYSDDGTPDVMNAAWGMITDASEITISLSEHKTTENLRKKGAFTVSMATEETVVACDYVGIVSAKDEPDKFAKAGFHAVKSGKVDAPLIEELPMALECTVKSYEDGILTGTIVNVTADESILTCSANTDLDGKNTAIFFGLSGTGKTTLSTDPKRLLIGDDEHGWDDNGVFNFEGGCYAKVINLDKDSEPDIYNAIRRDALLENVTVDANGKIDFADKSVTENTRVSYPIDHIKNIVRPISSAPAAKNVIFLSADAFGVLPPVSILTPEQTQYYFLSGFTAKLAGTERGITEPTPTFSACFGQAFLELHPTKYAEELVKKMQKSGAKAYLVNTGWNGSGKRISIKDTRGIIDAILNGDINNVPTKKIPYFDFEVPTELNGVDTGILDPRDTYADASEWETKAKDLAARFIKNFSKYEGNAAGKALVSAGPQL